MNKLLTITLLLAAAVAFSPELNAQDFAGLDKSPLDLAYYRPSRGAQPVMRVLYSRPQMNGREIFGEMIPYGKVWRLGANESTEIQFFQDVAINGTKVKAGRYTVYATPGEKELEVIFSSDVDTWGAYAYKAENNVASITVPVEASEKAIEAFSITFGKADNGAHMVMGWENTLVREPIEF